ncbi:MAG: AbrB/MazE/SpoVT family DNA-binding domain-containing protein [Gemmatimonadetes bacterium]|nr:AbrB/MazE/SpoVT family DNA-binding domain-containing protein [Gemmatimonadota bacterium]
MPRITSKGQVTIPKNIREMLGVKPGDQVEFELLPDQRVLVTPVLATAVFERYVGYLADRADEDPDRIVAQLRDDDE